MATSQSAQQDGRGNIVIQVVGSGNEVSVRSAGPALPLHGLSQGVSATLIRTETDILKPRCEANPFVGRESEVEGLWQWLRSSKSFSIRTIAGRGGSGKTRLGIEILRRMQTVMPEWQAGFLDHEELRECAGILSQRDFEWEKPSFMVLDYAASCVDPLKTIVRKLGQQLEGPGQKGHAMRVLLLERFADTETGWLNEVIDRSYGGDSAHFFETVVHLEPFGNLEQRYEILRQTVARGAAFHPDVVLAVPAAGSDPELDRRLLEPKCADPLVLMMAALTAFSTSWPDALSYSRADLAMRVAVREAERVKKCAQDRRNENLLLHMAAYATLCSSLSEQALVEAAAAELRALHAQYSGDAHELARDLTKALPGAAGVVGVSPDIVGEAFVIHVLCMQFQDATGTVRRAVAQDQNAIALVIRAVADFYHAGFQAPRAWLSAAVESAGTADSPDLYYAIERALPKESVELREASAQVTQALIGWLEKAAEGRADFETLDSERARLLSNSAVRLSALGRREEALAQAEEAVRLYRQLAAARPDAFLPDLARSLAVLGNCQKSVGQPDSAVSSFHESLLTVAPVLEKYPDALRGLATMIFQLYLRGTEAAGLEPDVELLGSIAETLESRTHGEEE